MNPKKIPPKIEWVREYIKEKGYPIDPEQFFDHYEAVGWYRGTTKIKDWTACIRTWMRNRKIWNNTGSVQTHVEPEYKSQKVEKSSKATATAKILSLKKALRG